MSDEYPEGSDLWAEIKRKAGNVYDAPNTGRIFDGLIHITDKEFEALKGRVKTRTDKTPMEKLMSIPVRIMKNGESVEISDGRMMVAFADKLYLLSEPKTTFPPLPRLYVDGVYVS